MTKYFKQTLANMSKKKPVPPREADVIGKEYALARAEAGDLQYQIYVHQNALDAKNAVLQRLSKEYADRLELDGKLQKETTNTEVSNESQRS